MQVLIPYMRKSSKEDPAVSRERQRSGIEAWVKQHPDVRLGPEVWEPGVSGSKPWRERGLGQAVADCEAGLADGIIVEEQSRLSRASLAQTAEVWEAFEKFSLRLVCVEEGIDTGNGSDQELNFGFNALMARKQWKDYARRIEHVKKVKVASGIHISGAVPYGYDRDPVTKRLVRNDKGEFVIGLFNRRAAGESLGSLARWLDKVDPGGATGKGKWNRNSVRRILSNRVYLGEARQGKKHINPKAHDALVDRDTFEIVKALGDRFEPVLQKNQGAMLAGFVRCAHCGYAMTRSISNKRYHVYKHRETGFCPSPSSIMLPALDDEVKKFVRAKFGKPVAYPRVPDAENGPIIAQIEKIDRRMKLYLKEEFADQYSEEEIEQSVAELAARKRGLQAQLVQREPERPSLDGSEEWTDEEWNEVLSSFLVDVLVHSAPRLTPVEARVTILDIDVAVPDWVPPRPSRRHGTKLNVEVESRMLAA